MSPDLRIEESGSLLFPGPGDGKFSHVHDDDSKDDDGDDDDDDIEDDACKSWRPPVPRPAPS